MPVKNRDLVITGGGLAGLGLAYQIKKAAPDTSITVLEKRQFPLPRAIAKVGESTVEIGSHYLQKHLDLSEHLKQTHLRKFGLRCYFGQPQDDFSAQDELGPSRHFGLPTYQLDRGDIENHLAEKVLAMGVEFIDGASVDGIDINGDRHQTSTTSAGGPSRFDSRWLIDASGRHALIKNKLRLAQNNNHQANAVWFRVDRRVQIDSWSSDPAWQQRCTPDSSRWLSTNHLMGPGYWVWIIPLASGITSIGIVMDDHAFEAAAIDSAASALRWLEQHQSRCAAAIAGATVLDFVSLRDYSYGCKQLFSEQRWGIIGEAGVFADPFYSPGSDFIAFSNCFLSDLIQCDQRGEDIRLKNTIYQRLMQSFYDSTLSLYLGQYGGFGDRRMMSLKLLWDYSYYWGVLALLFFQQSTTNLTLIRQLIPELFRIQKVNAQIQGALRRRAEKRLVLPALGLFINQSEVPCLHLLHQQLLQTDKLDPAQQLKDNVLLLERVALYVDDMLGDSPTSEISDDEHNLLGDYRQLILA